ncbi:prepilin-type N-terminal cleavage/methylation domain-containing protein [Shewanella sp. CG12_big_fil_rev_8_21_14_0_65_47_15]|uniref:prepilin-type N-terminal cleavage/methylation domain-containing protein n=1 Tax=Shewanella sp. CG12_big_fil_rev_8_21_14_0_65_47_15 TaxID=1975537 RepID=UPI000CCB0A4A|nr:prepilin-type N-terminal cleavage/methylation domain-containing protein [Shewanella sp. CG12_big_fil_rev_8_21_14_0_65_47_15]PIW59264.1 MAG: prepilin-type cleavage/methylation domain-containing protein [Shewanella sp. CG12_big_fil_rev_8_21_14_0_65_47_15]
MRQDRALEYGFTLLEVLVAMLLAALGLLGLALAQAKALQFSSSSLNYTVAVIQANNALERVWPELCGLQRGQLNYDEPFQLFLSPQAGDDPVTFTTQLPEYNFTASPYNGSLVPESVADFSVTVSWRDGRFSDAQANNAVISGSFPWLRNGGACE